jgi:hypothetical protein
MLIIIPANRFDLQPELQAAAEWRPVVGCECWVLGYFGYKPSWGWIPAFAGRTNLASSYPVALFSPRPLIFSHLPVFWWGERLRSCAIELPVPTRVPDAGALRRTAGGKACFSRRRPAQTCRGPQARGERATAEVCTAIRPLRRHPGVRHSLSLLCVLCASAVRFHLYLCGLGDLCERQFFLSSVARTERLLRRCPSTKPWQ